MTSVGALSPGDPSSFSRPDRCIVKHIHLALDIDFAKKRLSGRVDLNVEKINEIISELILDSKDLTVLSVIDLNSNESLPYVISNEIKPFGSKFSIQLPKSNQKNFLLRIKYETSNQASGLQWLLSAQTMGKKKPFMFSQFQAVHARSVIPCQDTPAVKCAYSADITAPTGITVLMSAISMGAPTVLNDGRTRFQFQQKVPIPSYLIAFAAGNLESRSIGPRSHVWAEPEIVEQAAFEFSETETMLAVAERICGPYQWKIYDLLVLPPSFPFGGMENPCLTFVTPTIVVGDRSLAILIAHEIAHSWTGNLVTNRNFEHFWLNEGFTVFLERKIAGRMKGQLVEDFEAINGVNALQETIDKLGATNPLTKLVLDLRGVHPDDSFSCVPYEKGQIFLRYLEDLVGGPLAFEPFLSDYLNNFKYRTVDTDDFQKAFMNYFKSNESIKSIDWNKWLKQPGMPPIIPKFDRTLVKACIDLRDKWVSCDGPSCKSYTSADISKLNANQIEYFLQLILESDPMPIFKLEKMEQIYKIQEMKNTEIKFRWIRIGLKAQWAPKIDDALRMVTEVGRMKFVRPLYQDLYNWESARQRAIDTFNANKHLMMYVTRYTVQQDLHLA